MLGRRRAGQRPLHNGVIMSTEEEQLKFYKNVNAFLGPDNQAQVVHRYSEIVDRLQQLNKNIHDANVSSSALAQKLNRLTTWIAIATVAYTIVTFLLLVVTWLKP
jgi:hypothetical protein